jgi:hypothetical protein
LCEQVFSKFENYVQKKKTPKDPNLFFSKKGNGRG